MAYVEIARQFHVDWVGRTWYTWGGMQRKKSTVAKVIAATNDEDAVMEAIRKLYFIEKRRVGTNRKHLTPLAEKERGVCSDRSFWGNRGHNRRTRKRKSVSSRNCCWSKFTRRVNLLKKEESRILRRAEEAQQKTRSWDEIMKAVQEPISRSKKRMNSSKKEIERRKLCWKNLKEAQVNNSN